MVVAAARGLYRSLGSLLHVDSAGSRNRQPCPLATRRREQLCQGIEQAASAGFAQISYSANQRTIVCLATVRCSI